LVEEFDWRNRHGANDPNKEDYYYDPNSDGEGWLTIIKDQMLHPNCKGLCYIYGPLAVVEGLANIYFNSHLNFDLSEQHVLDCDNHTNDECNGGPASATINFLMNPTGVVNEECYPMAAPNGSCQPFTYPGLLEYQIRTPNGTSAASISPHTADQKRESIILHGPIIAFLGGYVSDMAHYLALIGYGKLNIGDIIHLDPVGGDITIDEDSPYLGHSYWIYKNSWGTNWGDQGYMYHIEGENQFIPEFCKYFNLPIEDFLNLGRPIECFDKDNDGYCNWGIDEDPPTSGCPDNCQTKRDSDDSEPRIGPYDVNYYGTPVRPIMEVTCENEQIDNDGFFTFYETSQDRELIITISNQGNAQLNLVDPTFEDIVTSSNESVFEITPPPPTTPIAMEGGSTQFIIFYHYDPEQSFDQAVITINTLEPEYGAYQFVIANFDCDQSPGPDIDITVAETWDSQDIITGNVYVHSGAELTIEGTYGFIDGVDLNIKPGGRVIIDGGVLTNVCDNTWQGVDVWGNENLCQYPTSNQGYLNIINGGKIKNAEYGIQVANAIDLTSYARGTTGGIVKCDSAIFVNNKYDVIIYPYRNINPGTGEEVPNLSTFRNSFFLTDFGYAESESHVYLRGVDGVKFRGCTFENKTDFVDTPFNEKLDVGIYSFNSGFYVEDYCTNYSVPCNHSNRCLFNNLRYGVYALNSTSSKYICIDTAIFLNNLTGIYMSAVDEQRITSNDLLIDYFEDFSVAYDTPKPVGLYLETCKYYMIEENSFSNESTIENATGIHILNSGPYASEVYNNSFDGFYSGVTAAGENRNGSLEGLCLICNDFMRCETDIYVTPEGGSITANLGINQQQGLPNGQADGPAGNTFTIDDFQDLEKNYYNETANTIYYAHHLNLGLVKLEPNPYYNINVQPDPFADYSKQESCPSNLGGGIDIPTEMLTLSNESVQIEAYQDTLGQYVDGGDTDNLTLEVQTSFPDEAMQIRQELLNESPYLSDTVMETAIMKENVLPNVMIRDILVANPQSAKSAEVLNTLDDRFIPMPDYMMSEIMQGLNAIGAKEILEQELSKHKTIHSKSLSKLLRHYKQDTINAWAHDSLISLLLAEPFPGPHYKAAFIYLEQNDSLSIQSTLDNIPQVFILSDRETIVHNLFLDYFGILSELQEDSLASIDSIQELALLNIAQNDHLLTGLYARNHLHGYDLINYIEPIFLPESLKSTPTWGNYKPVSGSNSKLMKIFPNPAGGYFIIEYDLREINGKAVLILSDLNGRRLDSFTIEDKQNQQLLGTSSYPSGMYILQLFINNALIETHKVQIIK